MEQENKGNFVEQRTQKIQIFILGNKGRLKNISGEQPTPTPPPGRASIALSKSVVFFP